MWDWLVDEPFWIYWITVGVGGLFLLAALYTQRAVYLLGVIAAAGMLGLIALADYCIVTDRETVESIVREMVQAAQNQSADDILRHVANSFQSGPVNRQVLEQELNRSLPLVTRIRMGKLIVEPATEGPGFVADLNVSFTGSYEGQVGESSPLLIRMRFDRDHDGKWKLYTAEVYDALGHVRYWPR